MGYVTVNHSEGRTIMKKRERHLPHDDALGLCLAVFLLYGYETGCFANSLAHLHALDIILAVRNVKLQKRMKIVRGCPYERPNK